jgi:cell wall-associated NlpC family hydrolase
VNSRSFAHELWACLLLPCFPEYRRPNSVTASRRLLAPLALATALFAVSVRAGAQSLESKKPFAAFSASAQSLRDSLVSKARGQIGTRYVLGGNAPNRGLDCSGLVKYVMGALDLIMPRTANQQASVGKEVPRDLASLKPGDLLTFGRGKTVSHVGIYVGNGRMVHASTSKRQVIETPISVKNPLIRQWLGVRRLIEGPESRIRDSLLALVDTLR